MLHIATSKCHEAYWSPLVISVMCFSEFVTIKYIILVFLFACTVDKLTGG